MAVTAVVDSLERLAQDVFEAVKELSLAAPRGRRGAEDLKEGEFLTLALLAENDTMIVGDIQRELGVLPAQMSRIIRSLESRPRPCVACQINPQDKRKINVQLTEEGEHVFRSSRQRRVARILEILQELDESELGNFAGIIDHVLDILRHKSGD
jgi:DNA-binding MarR family transcriptional regulator